MKKNLLALKPYLESAEELCGRLSKEELTGVILALAKEVPANQRSGFLGKIRRLSRERPPSVTHEHILTQIEALRQEIRDRIASIENGSYYEDRYQEYRSGSRCYDEYDDDAPDTLSEDQTEELEELFKEASQLFVSRRLAEAGAVYAALFNLLKNPYEVDEEEGSEPLWGDYYISDYDLEVEMREARARYCRCVYETTPLPERLQTVIEALNPDVRLVPGIDVYENNHPMLSDVMDCLTGELPDLDEFLLQWKKELGRHSSERADMLLLEAAHLTDGIEGLGSLVRSWGERQPRAWLFWIRLLAREEDWKGAAGIAEEALTVVGQNAYRALIAEKLVEAGAKIGRPELVLTGKRESFLAVPEESRLIRLIGEADRQNLKSKELEGALAFFSSKEKGEKTLWVKLLLMTGRIEAAFELAGNLRPLGWSYGESAGAVLYGAVLSLLCVQRIEAAVTVQRLLRRYADDSDHLSDVTDDEGEDGAGDQSGKRIRISDEILKVLHRVRVSEEQKDIYMKWTLKIGRRRIEQIVGNQHRGAYDRAAEILGGLAECFHLNGEREKGRRIIDEYRNQKYNRHSAFRRELDCVIATSVLLQCEPPE